MESVSLPQEPVPRQQNRGGLWYLEHVPHSVATHLGALYHRPAPHDCLEFTRDGDPIRARVLSVGGVPMHTVFVFIVHLE